MSPAPATAALNEENAASQVRLAALILKLRGMGIADRAVLKAIESVPRELFVAKEWRELAFSDHSLPIACGQMMEPASISAVVVSALDVSDRHSVLEIGTGSGYQTAVLAKLARRVTTVERFRTLSKAAERHWVALALRNISAIVADGTLGWKRQAPFDRIVVGAACAEPPGKLIAQLTSSGILIAPIRMSAGAQRLTLFQRIGRETDIRDLGPARFMPIIPGVAQSL
jgi:protein-L-isoaspartate(D-aspartate) O-methyltransferase